MKYITTVNILQSRHVRKRKKCCSVHVQEEEEEEEGEEEEEEVLSLVEEFKPDKLNLAQTLAGMLSIANCKHTEEGEEIY